MAQSLYEILNISRDEILNDSDNNYSTKKLNDLINKFDDENSNLEKRRALSKEIELLISNGLEKYDELVFQRQNDELIGMLAKRETANAISTGAKFGVKDERLAIAKRRISKNFQKRREAMGKEKDNRKFSIKKTCIIAGVIVAIGLGTIFGVSVSNHIKEDNNSNVCVKYVIQEGDTLNKLEKEYGLKDVGFLYLVSEGHARQQAAYDLGQDINEFIIENEVIGARTTEEKAEKFAAEKGATITTAKYLTDGMSETGSIRGKFKEMANGSIDPDFFRDPGAMAMG